MVDAERAAGGSFAVPSQAMAARLGLAVGQERDTVVLGARLVSGSSQTGQSMQGTHRVEIGVVMSGTALVHLGDWDSRRVAVAPGCAVVNSG